MQASQQREQTMTTNYVALLGTKGGPAIRPGSSMPTSSLIHLNGRAIVIDCGLGVTRGIIDQNIALKELSMIFITHLHSDHYLELGPLIHTAWTAGLKTTVDIWGPKGLDDYWDHFLSSMRADIELRISDEGRPDLRTLINIHIIEAGQVTQRDGITVDAMRVEHPPLIDCFALSFKGDDTHVVFSGDTAPMDALASWASGCDLLIHEAMLEEALPALFKRIGNGDDRLKHHWMRSHTLAHDAARLATQAGVSALALHHLIPSDDPDFTQSDWQKATSNYWQGTLHVGHDGLVIPLDKQV